MLRDYQQRIVDNVIAWIRKSYEPCCVEAATGAGKSHCIASIAEWTHSYSGKKVLCLAPSKELVHQNHSKYLATGNPASIFCGSLNKKDTRHAVVFGSPLTVKNQPQRFKDYAAVIVDECHGMTPTVKTILANMRASNPYLRIIGLSATPYRMNTGYVYENHYQQGAITETKNPYFKMLVAEVGAWELIEQGYLAPPVFPGDLKPGYDTSGLILNSSGNWNADTVDRAFTGKGRLTAEIVGDVVEHAQGRRGVIFYAATIEHAHEIYESLPKEISGIVTSKDGARDETVQAFQAQKIKYLVNVSCLTTGFDATHVDVIAMLRATESPGLLTQIMGRGLRPHEGKHNCLMLDYAENIERHFPDGDVFKPSIEVSANKKAEPIQVKCPVCGFVQEFGKRPNPDGYRLSEDGYFMDLGGQKMDTPSHYGRRCKGGKLVAGEWHRCGYFWTGKQCYECGADNDIAARFCSSCKSELVDPNEKLQRESAKLQNSRYAVQESDIQAIGMREYTSKRSGKTTLKIDYVLDGVDAQTISEWLTENMMKMRTKQLGIYAESIPEAVQKQAQAEAHKIWWKKEKGSKYPKVVTVGR
jgi:DNA repair protein RadD